MKLEDIGWTPELEISFGESEHAHLIPGRISGLHGKQFQVITETGEVAATLMPGERRASAGTSTLPAVGDWVGLERSGELDSWQVRQVFQRKNVLSRTGSGRTSGEQVIAANIDVAFIITGLDGDFNVRRLERYLSMVYETGAEPVIILNKTDKCADVETHMEAALAIVPGTGIPGSSIPGSSIPVVPVSAKTGEGMNELKGFIDTGKTVVLVGSSGVGKSTLINYLLGYERQEIGDVRESDGKGRHVTTARELIPLPDGGLLIDNPGIRELALWSTGKGISMTFSDIEELAAGCRFNDCMHESEPGCAVKRAIEDDELAEERLASYRKLMLEQQHARRRRDSYEKKKHEKSLTKMYRHADTVRRLRGKK